MWRDLVWVGLAGAAGTLCRYGLSNLVYKVAGGRFPWATLAVNLAGCFFFGLIWALAEERTLITGQTRLILLAGFMGAFTTFSTLAFETSVMVQSGQWLPALAYVLLQNVLGVLAVFAGFYIVRLS